MNNKKVVDSHYAKSKEYRKVLDDIARKGVCPFCPGNFKHHKHPVLKKIGGWLVTEASWKYKNAENHFLIISLGHKEDIDELSAKDMADILKLAQWTVDKFRIKGGGLAMRFGNTSHTGATVCHLHCHLIVPKIKKKKKRAKTVNFPIG